MGKQILVTIVWSLSLLFLLSIMLYFTGVNKWLEEALDWTTPATIGCFFGYGFARRKKNR